MPILNIYRCYYGPKAAAVLGLIFRAAMAGATYVIEMVLGAVGLIPTDQNVQIMIESISWNYTT